MDKLRFILLFVVVLLAGNAAAYDFESGGLYYNILDADAKTVEVTLEGEKDGWDTKSSYSGDIVIPSTVTNGNETYSVKKIGQYAFCRSEIISLTIQNGIETIDECAFLYSSQLVDVSLPSSLTSIGNSAFFNCYQITELVIPEGVSTIGNQAFCYCGNMKTLQLPSTLTEIGDRAFGCCGSLTKVISRITTPFAIEKTTFSSTENWEDGVNNATPSAANLYVPQGTKSSYMTYEGWTRFAGIYEGEPQEITLSDGLIYSYVTGEHIANVIGWENLNSDSLTIRSIVEINGENYSVKSVGPNAFSNCGSIRSLTIENGVETIGDYAFRWCWQLESVVLPEGVLQIGRYSFSDCNRLKRVSLPSTTKSIGDGAFRGLGALYAVTSYIQEPFDISKNVFAAEEKWNEQEQKYYYTPSSATLYVPTDTKTSYEALEGWNMFAGIVEGDLHEETIDGVIYSYNKADQTATVVGGDLSDSRKVTILGSIIIDGVDYVVKTISAGAFRNNYYVDSLIVSSGIETIENFAFNECYNIKYVELPSTLTTIGEYAFSYCGSIQNLILPSSLTTIGDFAFCGNNLKTVTSRIQSPLEINQSVFCSRYESYWDETEQKRVETYTNPQATLYVPIGTKSAYEAIEGWSVFPEIVEGEIKQTTYGGLNYTYIEGKGTATVTGRADSELFDIVIPGTLPVGDVNYSVKTIGARAFYDISLKSVKIEDGVETIEENAFWDSDGINELVLPSTLKTIGQGAFTWAYISTLVLPEGLIRIDQNAFSSCPNLKQLELPSTLDSIGDGFYFG